MKVGKKQERRGLICVRTHKQNVVQSTANHWQNSYSFWHRGSKHKNKFHSEKSCFSISETLFQKNESKEDESLSEASGFI